MVRALMERYLAAQDPYDAATLAQLRHRTWTAEWPQSDERIPSHDADVAIHSSYEGYPGHQLDRLGGADEVWRSLPTAIIAVPVRISGASDIWIAEVRLDYPDDGVWLAVMVVELADGLIGRETVYYCRASGSAPWPASFTDTTPVLIPPLAASMEHDLEAESHHVEAHAGYLERLATDPDAAVGILFHEGAVLDRPQYGLRASGRSAISEIDQVEAPPRRTRRVLASGHVLVSESRVGPVADSWCVVRILQFRGDQVTHAAEYLAEPYEPPDARKPWIERLDEDR